MEECALPVKNSVHVPLSEGSETALQEFVVFAEAETLHPFEEEHWFNFIVALKLNGDEPVDWMTVEARLKEASLDVEAVERLIRQAIDGLRVLGRWEESPRRGLVAEGAGVGRQGAAALRLELSEDERSTLESWAKRPGTERSLALRCKIVLACADGLGNTEVALRLGVCPATVSRWRLRFAHNRLAGVHEGLRPG